MPSFLLGIRMEGMENRQTDSCPDGPSVKEITVYKWTHTTQFKLVLCGACKLE